MNIYAKKKILIICRDAGGAELISSWLKFNKISFSGIISGPAKNIFKQKKLKFKKIPFLKNAIKENQIIITGTGWNYKEYFKSWNLAKKYKKIIISFIDHWKNYKLRFKFKKKYFFPQEIWVSDIYAKKKAKKIFTKSKIRLIKNHYLEQLRKKKTHYRKKNKIIIATNNLDAAKKILKEKIKISDEFFVLKSINFIKNKYDSKNIYLKIHPSEKRKKYIQILKRNNLTNIKMLKDTDQIKFAKSCKVLIACETNLLPVSKALGIKTYNFFLEGKINRVVPRVYFDNYLRV